jgi:hypothetical protein
MKRVIVAILFFTLALFVSAEVIQAEVIQYEIYELSTSGGKPRLIAKGKRDYSLEEVVVHPSPFYGAQKARKLIELEQGYRVGAYVVQEKQLKGFGLIAQQSDTDFSWEWYDRETDNRFRKRQGRTYVKARVEGTQQTEELVEVTFSDDTRLRIKTGRSRDDTHVILIKAGSVFRFK